MNRALILSLLEPGSRLLLMRITQVIYAAIAAHISFALPQPKPTPWEAAAMKGVGTDPHGGMLTTLCIPSCKVGSVIAL